MRNDERGWLFRPEMVNTPHHVEGGLRGSFIQVSRRKCLPTWAHADVSASSSWHSPGRDIRADLRNDCRGFQ